MRHRLTVRLPDQLVGWIVGLGGDQAATARALIIVGAAALGLPGTAREAQRALSDELGADLAAALWELAANRQPTGSQPAVSAPEPPELPAPTRPALLAPAPSEVLETLLAEDPFAVGFEV